MEILKIRIILDKILKWACDFRMIAYKYKMNEKQIGALGVCIVLTHTIQYIVFTI